MPSPAKILILIKIDPYKEESKYCQCGFDDYICENDSNKIESGEENIDVKTVH